MLLEILLKLQKANRTPRVNLWRKNMYSTYLQLHVSRDSGDALNLRQNMELKLHPSVMDQVTGVKNGGLPERQRRRAGTMNWHSTHPIRKPTLQHNL
jgi:hypothetical protein